MGYRIQYTELEGALSAVVSGRSSLAAAGCIARDIAAQAARRSIARVLVDLRWLEDRVGTLRALLALPRLRVAVLDVGENDPYYPLREHAELRYFAHVGAAMRWLRVDQGSDPRIDPQSPRGDRKAPTPPGAALRTPLEIYGG